MFQYKTRYNHIISFGCMCSCALFLKKNGFRDSSYFFDWLTSNFFGNLETIKNDFSDVTNPSFFKQEYAQYPHLVTNTKYGFVFTHVFDTKSTYNRQKNKVEKYINKRVLNFKNALADNSLLVYYCRDAKEQKEIEKSSEAILYFCEKNHVDIIFIFNNKVSSGFPFKSFIIPYNNIHHPIGGEVSYPFEGGDTDKLINWLTSKYDASAIARNLKFKKRRNFFAIVINKLKRHKKNIFKI